MAKQGFVWYKDNKYRFTMIAMAAIGIMFNVAVWVVDGEIKDFSALLLFGSGMLVSTLAAYLFRNNQ